MKGIGVMELTKEQLEAAEHEIRHRGLTNLDKLNVDYPGFVKYIIHTHALLTQKEKELTQAKGRMRELEGRIEKDALMPNPENRVCNFCRWTNSNTNLNIGGDVGEVWICHGCVKSQHEQLTQVERTLKETQSLMLDVAKEYAESLTKEQLEAAEKEVEVEMRFVPSEIQEDWMWGALIRTHALLTQKEKEFEEVRKENERLAAEWKQCHETNSMPLDIEDDLNNPKYVKG
jgi:hypothetical protein